MTELPAPSVPASIRLVADGTALRAAIDDPSAATDTRYAIYLLRNGERVAVRGYAADHEARFDGPHVPGSYTATGFCHDVAADARRKAHSPALAVARPPMAAPRRPSYIPETETVESTRGLVSTPAPGPDPAA